MSKVASVISVEFETPEEVSASIKHFMEQHENLSRDLEHLTAVRTSDTSMMVIQVHPSQESYERYDAAIENTRLSDSHRPKEVIKLEGTVPYMVHHTRYTDL